MNRWIAVPLLAGAMALWAAGVAEAQGKGKVDFGKREYDAKCAGCHGPKGKGDGPFKPYLTRTPSDLSTLAKSNKGVFPYQTVYEVVDGRTLVEGHGPREMPIWGADYLAKSAAEYMDVPYDPELYVRTRIIALVDYLNRLQVK